MNVSFSNREDTSPRNPIPNTSFYWKCTHPVGLELTTSPSSPPCSYMGRAGGEPFELELTGNPIPH